MHEPSESTGRQGLRAENNTADFRRAGVPGGGGYATARAMAAFYQMLVAGRDAQRRAPALAAHGAVRHAQLHGRAGRSQHGDADAPRHRAARPRHHAEYPRPRRARVAHDVRARRCGIVVLLGRSGIGRVVRVPHRTAACRTRGTASASTASATSRIPESIRPAERHGFAGARSAGASGAPGAPHVSIDVPRPTCDYARREFDACRAVAHSGGGRSPEGGALTHTPKRDQPKSRPRGAALFFEPRLRVVGSSRRRKEAAMREHRELPDTRRHPRAPDGRRDPGRQDAIEPVIAALDAHRGVLLASSYEYPGRYTRWDMGFIDPPLALVARERRVRVRGAERARGRSCSPRSTPALRALEAVDGVERDGDALAVTVKALHGPLRRGGAQPPALGLLGAPRAHRSVPATTTSRTSGSTARFGYDLAFQFEPIRLRLDAARATSATSCSTCPTSS